MTLKVMADNRVEISAKQDGAVYNVALGDKDFIIEGLGDEFAMSYTGLVVSVESGEAVVHGRHITADEQEQITLPQNQSGYLVLRIDLTQVSGAEAMLYATPTLTNEEINWSGNIYDMPIATFTTSNTGVTNFEDVRKINGSFYPTKVSELENDLDFALKSYVDAQDTALNNALTKKDISSAFTIRENIRAYSTLKAYEICGFIYIYFNMTNSTELISRGNYVFSTLNTNYMPEFPISFPIAGDNGTNFSNANVSFLGNQAQIYNTDGLSLKNITISISYPKKA